MAASDANVAVAYHTIGDSINVAIYRPFIKPATSWLPDGLRIFDVPFKTISSLLFNKEGSVLVAAVGGDYLIDWDLARSMFEPDVVFNKGLTSPWFAQSANLVDRGNVSIMVLGMGPTIPANPAILVDRASTSRRSGPRDAARSRTTPNAPVRSDRKTECRCSDGTQSQPMRTDRSSPQPTNSATKGL